LEENVLSPRPVAKGSAKIKDQEGKELYTIAPSALTWELITRFGEKNEIFFEAKLNHPYLGLLAWRVWEYPPVARNSTETDVGKHTLLEDFEIGLEVADKPKS
jgi:hypothetical protein